jgi:WD40 repeat protein
MPIYRFGLSSAFLAIVVSASVCVESPAVGQDSPIRPSLVAQAGNGDRDVFAVALSSDGKLLASGSYKSVELWDVATGLELRSFPGLSWATTCLAFDPGKHLLAAGTRGEVVVWNLASGERVQRFEAAGEVSAIAFSPDGRRLAVAGETKADGSGGLTVWDVSTGKLSLSVGIKGDVKATAFRADGERLAAWSSRDGLQVCEATTGRPVWARAAEHVSGIAFTPDGKTLSTVTDWEKEKAAVSYAADTGEPASARHQDASWDDVSLSPDGLTFATVDRDVKVVLHDVASGRPVQTMNSIERLGPHRVTLGGKAVALWGLGPVRVWDVATGQRLGGVSPNGETKRFRDVVVEPSGEILAFVMKDGITQWDLRADRHEGVVGKDFVRFSPDGKRSVTGGMYLVAGAPMLYLSDRAGNLKARLPGYSAPVAFDQTSSKLACVNADGKVVVLNVASRAELRTFDGDYARPIALAFWQNGTILSSVGGPSINTWTVATGELMSSHSNPDDWYGPTGISADGVHLIAGSGPFHRAGAPMGVFDVASAKREIDLKVGSLNVGSVGFRASVGELASRVYLGAPETFTTFDPKGRFWLTGTPEGGATLCLGTPDRPRPAATIVFFLDGGWVVADPDGRYDGSNQGDVAGLHWVVGDRPLPLKNFKDQYYDPGLLSKLLGLNHDRLRPLPHGEAGHDAPQVPQGLAAHPPADAQRTGPTSALDRLDPATIPAGLRFAGQPQELVAVLGDEDVATDILLLDNTVCFSPDGKWLISGHFRRADNTVCYDLSTFSEVELLPYRATLVGTASSKDGTTLCLVERDKVTYLRLKDAKFERKATYDFATERLALGLDLSRDGKTLAVVNPADGVSVWPLGGEKPFRPQVGGDDRGPDRVICAALSPDGRQLATSSDKGWVRVWNIAEGNPSLQASVQESIGPVWALAFSPDGTALATGSWTGSVRLWKILGQDVSLVKSLDAGGIGHPDDDQNLLPMHTVAFTPDGRGLITASSFDTINARIPYVNRPDYRPGMTKEGEKRPRVMVWDLGAGRKLREWRVPCLVRNVTVAADGRHFATSNANGTTYIFRYRH